MCVATRVAIGFRAGCHRAKGKCSIKQKMDNKYYLITCTSITNIKTHFYINMFISNYINNLHKQKR